jgi:oxygen-independent coproporphyrinogen III oxidase
MERLTDRTGAPFGVYVHFPFCLRRCPYCDFKVTVVREIPHKAYLEAVLAELSARKAQFAGRKLASVYFGGGTPGLWEPSAVRSVLEAITDTWELVDDPVDVALADGGAPLEVTVEINPRRAPVETLAALREAGAGRLSVGCQSFDDAYLRALGRDHDAGQGRATLAAAAAAGWGRVNLDLIYGGPSHGPELFAADLAVAAASEVDHISAYQLTVHEGTPFARMWKAGRLNVADHELSAALDGQCEAALSAAGFWRYEVSNYARAGGVARHNSLYWTGAEYMGLGVGAHELCIRDGTPVRREGAGTVAAYLANPASHARIEPLEPEQHLGERLFTALRTGFGVHLDTLAAQLGPALAGEALRRLAPLEAEGYVTRESGPIEGVPFYLVPDGLRFVPTARGFRYADDVGAAVV